MSAIATYRGITSYCKECWKIKSRLHRAENLERVQEYDRNRSALPHRVEARKAYAQTKEYKESVAKSQPEWIARNKEKRQAHILTGNAVRDGRLIKAPCEVCGNSEVDAHHDDYGKPMVVRWLCRTHHADYHKRLREHIRRRLIIADA